MKKSLKLLVVFRGSITSQFFQRSKIQKGSYRQKKKRYKTNSFDISYHFLCQLIHFLVLYSLLEYIKYLTMCTENSFDIQFNQLLVTINHINLAIRYDVPHQVSGIQSTPSPDGNIKSINKFPPDPVLS